MTLRREMLATGWRGALGTVFVTAAAAAVCGAAVAEAQRAATTVESRSSTGATVSGEDSTVSADGRYVAFSSISTNVVADDTNGARAIALGSSELRVAAGKTATLRGKLTTKALRQLKRLKRIKATISSKASVPGGGTTTRSLGATLVGRSNLRERTRSRSS